MAHRKCIAPVPGGQATIVKRFMLHWQLILVGISPICDMESRVLAFLGINFPSQQMTVACMV